MSKTNKTSNRTENSTQRIGRQADSSTAQVRTTRQVVQPVTQVVSQTVSIRQATPARQPVTIKVRSTGEMIDRVLIERSGYRVVRYDSRYHVVRGGGRVQPYILGHDDTDDVLGIA